MPKSSKKHLHQKTIHELPERELQILQFTLQEYISTATPVSSKILAKRYLPQLSSATVRNAMANLEEKGLLRQPHPSAGRIPTEAGFRLYIDWMMKPKDLSPEEKARFHFHDEDNPLENIRSASRFLSQCSNQIGLVTSPSLENTIFREIQFVRIGENKILAVFVAKKGWIEQRVVHWENPPTQEELWKMANYLNELLKDCTLGEARRRISQEMENERNRYDDLIAKALKLRSMFFESQEEVSIFIEGHSRLMEQPEFMGHERIRHLFEAFEQKQTLLRILELADQSSQDTARIVLAEELDPSYKGNFSGLAFVTRSYGTPHQSLGALAIAGPTRMDYRHILPIVNFTAEKLNDLFR